MHVGMTMTFQNPGKPISDHQMYKNELKLADLAEPLGFDSIWGIEHHFTDYICNPDVTQFLTYMAGRTEKILLGSSVLVLPWHDPMWMAEKISMLDNISDGRVILGIGRGAGKVEFDGYRLDMGESRERFVEAAKIILPGLERGYLEHDGKFFKQERAEIRPAPFKSFRGRTYAAAVSPESAKIMAELGIGLLIIPQKPWADVERELKEYHQIFRDVNGLEAPQPLQFAWTFCDEDKDRAYEKAVEFIGGYYETVLDHYQFASDHMKTMKGYEWYGKFADRIQKTGEQAYIDYFLDLQCWGTPEMCIEKILEVQERVNSCGFVAALSYSGMSLEEGERNTRLFAEKVMPAIQAFDAGGAVDGSAQSVAAQ
jgi:alkanesulfonate monooxygenase SsuD/methylene tetrahydromethanopterin reductase-like flavin-dependent oxidoreductase (luciferase family)